MGDPRPLDEHRPMDDAPRDDEAAVRRRTRILRRAAALNAAHAADELGPGPGAQSVHRALSLLHVVGLLAQESPQGVGLAEIAQVVSRPKPSIHRLLSALVDLGYVERVPASSGYRLGIQSQVLGGLAQASADPVVVAARQSLRRIAQTTGDTAHLTLRAGSYAICALREDGPQAGASDALMVGDRHPLGYGAGSLAIMAGLPDTEIEEVLQSNAGIPATRYPRMSDAVVRELVAEARDRGAAVNPGLLALGSWAVGVVIAEPRTAPRAALSVATSEARLSGARRTRIVELLREEAGRIERGLVRS
jgi:DNA-binding IclR family transcriptional regulator